MEKIKVIFLDIDGVLRPVQERGFNKKCVDNLNFLTKETGAKIVISSTWRERGIEEVIKFLKDHDVEGDIIDITPIFVAQKAWGKDWEKQIKVRIPRGLEIREWIRDYTNMERYIESYVIVDDSEDMLLNQVDHYVKVDQTKGFDKKCLNKALNILDIINISTI